MHLRKTLLLFIGALVLVAGATAQAGFVNLGTSGWRAEWDSSLDPFVDINYVTETSNAVFIQKAAEFTQGPVNGVFPSIPIIFRQIAWPAVSNIVIDDEIIVNSTGHDWTDFHIDLVDGQDALFDPVATANSGGGGPIGFSISPFMQAAFSGDLQRLDIWDGVVPNGGAWFPGDGATDGQLWINVNPHQEAPFTLFTLKETPTPEPASLVLLALGSVLMLRRRG